MKNAKHVMLWLLLINFIATTLMWIFALLDKEDIAEIFRWIFVSGCLSIIAVIFTDVIKTNRGTKKL